MQIEQGPSSESALRRVRIEQLPITHEDPRRSFTEFFDSNLLPADLGPVKIGGVKLMDITQPKEGEDVVVGGHWEQATEVIWVREGEISSLKLADINTREEALYENLPAGTRIILPPLIAHQLRFKNAASLVILNEAPFSPAKLQIYPPCAT